MEKKLISTDKAPTAIGPYSQAVAAGGFLFCSGQIPVDPETGDVVSTDMEQATRRVLDNLNAVLKAAGLGLEAVVKTTVYLKNMDDFAAMNAVYTEYFSSNPPARATVQAARLPKEVLVEIDAVAIMI
jgi:2-iminobutanoate/2-iminopropanoate deaminase